MTQKIFTLWLTGLSGSGKTTFAEAFKATYERGGRSLVILDGDVLRRGLCRDLGFSLADRAENNRRIAEIAKLLNESGVSVVAALISPSREYRSAARQIIGPEFFHEVHVNTPLDVCEKRDPKGLYRKARENLIPEFSGISSPYEAPEQPDFTVDYHLTPQESVDLIYKNLS